MTEFKCENCAKSKDESERASVPLLARLLFSVTYLIFTGTVTWSKDVCKSCVKQRYLLSTLVLIGVAIFLTMLL